MKDLVVNKYILDSFNFFYITKRFRTKIHNPPKSKPSFNILSIPVVTRLCDILDYPRVYYEIFYLYIYIYIMSTCSLLNNFLLSYKYEIDYFIV